MSWQKSFLIRTYIFYKFNKLMEAFVSVTYKINYEKYIQPAVAGQKKTMPCYR